MQQVGPDANSSRSSYHHGDLRSALQRAAIDIVRETGLDAVTMRSVAKRAGVSEAAPYHHFENKADLLANAAILAFGDFGRALSRGVQASRADGDDPAIGLADAYVTWGLAHPGEYQLMFGRHIVDLGIGTRADAREAGGATIRTSIDAIEASLVRRDSTFDAEQAFPLLRSLLHGIVALVHEKEFGTDMTVEQAIDMAQKGVDAILDGL